MQSGRTFDFDWQERYRDSIRTAPVALELIKPGNSIFIGTGCAQPQHLVHAMMERAHDIYDAHIIHLLTMAWRPTRPSSSASDSR